MRRLLIVPLLLGVSITSNSVNSAEINCESQVWKNKEICIEKRRKKETRPDFCQQEILTPIQEEECLAFERRKSKEFNRPLEYPISIGGGRVNNYYLREFLPPNEESTKPKYLTHIQLRSEDGSDLVIARVNSAPIGFNISKSFVDIEQIVIPKKNIIAWSKNGESRVESSAAKTWGAAALLFNPAAIFLTPFGIINVQDDYFQISYFNNQGLKKDFYFYHWWPDKNKIPDLIPRFIEKISGLQSGEIRSEEDLKPMLLISLKNLEIERERLEDILFISKSESNACMILNKEKYPNLFRKYQSKLDLINEYKLKLDIPIDKNKKSCK